MKFTLTFSSGENSDLSYGLVFVPSPVWLQGKREIINLNPGLPSYQKGSIGRLLKHEFALRNQAIKHCIVTVHPVGHESETDLNTLLGDLHAEGYIR